MKKPVLYLILIANILAFTSIASADFDYGANSSLGLSIYNPDTGVETGYDLGVIGSGLNITEKTTLSSVDVSDTNATVALYSATSGFSFYFGLTTPIAPGIGGQFISFQGAVSDVFNIGYQNGVSPVTIAPSEPKSAYSKFADYGNYQGVVSGGIPSWHPSLESLEAGDDWVFIYLFQYNPSGIQDDPNTEEDERFAIVKGNSDTTDYRAIIGIKSNGDVVLNPENAKPTIQEIKVSTNTVAPGGTTLLTADVIDETASVLKYVWSWTISGEDYSKAGNPLELTIPNEAATEDITVALEVSDRVNPSVSETKTISIDGGGSGPTWPPASVTFTTTPDTLDWEGGNVDLKATTPAGWDDNELTWTWSTTYDGITIADTGAKETSFTAPENRGATAITIPIKLQVSHSTHGEGPTATKNVTVNPDGSGSNNDPTGVSASAGATAVTAGETIILTASATDADGDILYYTWTSSISDNWSPAEAQFTGDSVSGVTATTDYVTDSSITSAQTITFTLSVTDNQGGSPVTAQTVAVTVNPIDPGPDANAGGYQKVQIGTTVVLDGSQSTGDNLSYSWEQTGGTSVDLSSQNSAQAEFTAPETVGSLTFKLTVTDGEGETDAESCTIDVVDDYVTPVAKATTDTPEVWENDPVELDGTGSTVNDSTIIEWTLQSGPEGISVNLSGADTLEASFTAPEIANDSETFVFQLALNEPNTTDESFSNVTVTVKKNLPPTTPTSNLTDPINDEGVWESSELRPTLEVVNAEDPEGDALTYEFELWDDILDLENLEHLIAGAEIPQGNNITSWTTPQLEENTLYYFRARAGHELDGGSRLSGSWMEMVPIFINSEEEAPGVPEILSPKDGESINAVKPTLAVINTTDPDRDALTYDFRIYENFNDLVDDRIFGLADVLQNDDEGSTAGKFEEELEENRIYYWRARAKDSSGLYGEWTAPVSFLVDSNNDSPSKPEVVQPEDGGEVNVLTPGFLIMEGIDPEGETATLTIYLDTENTFDTGALITSEAVEVTTLQGTTWTVPEDQSLTDNTIYYCRAEASDGASASVFSDTVSFFVNLENDPPGKLDNYSPEDAELITSFTPTLIATATTEPVDPDYDAVTYAFELFLAGDLTDPVETIDELEEPQWEVRSDAINNGKKYYWHARVVDEHGEAGEWSDLTEFNVGANYYQPSIPERISPFNNGTVNTLTPTLSVVASDDSDGDDIWVEFELYRDSILSDLVSFTMVARSDTATSWQVDVTLEDQTDYYWRARATDGKKYSSWTTTALFRVDLNGDSTPQISIQKVANYDPAVPWYTVLEVDDTESDIYGARVIVPPGALSYNETLYIGAATGVPSMEDDLMPLGKVVDFGPSGTEFNVPVTIKIPYTDEDLETAGGVAPEDLSVYTYNEADRQWEMIAVDEVDEEEKLLICEVDHFSLYSSAASADGNSNPGNGDPDASSGGGGGGGCFIGAAGAPIAAGAGLRWLIAAALTMRLVVRRR